MWLGMFAALLDVFHFSVQVLSVRTRALTKMFLQLLICTLQLQKGNKQTARWTLEEAQKIIILHRPKQSRYISSISSIFLASPYPYQRTWMSRLRSRRGPVALYDDHPGDFVYIFHLILLKPSEGGGSVTVPYQTCSPSVLKNFQSSSNSVGVGLCQVKWRQREYFKQKL